MKPRKTKKPYRVTKRETDLSRLIRMLTAARAEFAHWGIEKHEEGDINGTCLVLSHVMRPDDTYAQFVFDLKGKLVEAKVFDAESFGERT